MTRHTTSLSGRLCQLSRADRGDDPAMTETPLTDRRCATRHVVTGSDVS